MTGRPPAESDIRMSMVGFFDLLGFSNEIKKADIPTDFLRIANSVRDIQKYFEYKSTNETIKDVHRLLDKTVLAFSDCVVASISFETDTAKTLGLFDLLASEIFEIAYSQSRCVLDGHFIRGGLDFGMWYYKRDLLVSPAMVGAYGEERKRAIYPVIAISSRLYRLLRDHEGRKHYSDVADPFPVQFHSFTHPETKKRIWFLNYLRLMAINLDWQYDPSTLAAYRAAPQDSDERQKIMNEGYTKNLIRYFGQHRDVILAAREAAPRDVSSKYDFLAKYHNKEVKRFLSKPQRMQVKIIT